MNCPTCGAVNRDTANFCASCAAPLRTTATAGTVASSPGRDVSQHSNHHPPARPPAEAPQRDDVQLPPPRPPQADAATDQTAPLPNLRTGFTALPEGALLHDDRYTIQEILSEGPRVNVYQARDNRPVRRCPNQDCGSLKAAPDDTHCPQCGLDLSQTRPTYLTFLLREAADPARFNVEGQLVGRQLSHPGLLLPEAYFTAAPYADSHRAYLVVPESRPSLAASLPLPQKLSQVLDWGAQLARAMAYLHEHQVSLRQVGLNRIAIEGNGRVARWTNLSEVEVISSLDRASALQRLIQDIYLLAQALLQLITGRERYSPTLPLPDAVKDLFARALTPQQGPFLSAQEFSLALEEALVQVHRPDSVNLIVGSRSDVGRERHLNEDGLLTLLLNQVQESLNQPLGLFVVADGMGGHSAGEVATRLTLDAVRNKAVAELLTPATQLPAYDQWLQDACSAANAAVLEQHRHADTDMGNTLVMALVVGDSAFVSNVGDSRAYLIDQGGIRQITTDHSLVARLVAAGQITPQEARTHPQRNVIYRTIGDKPGVETDVFTQRLAVGDYLLLCSDGLSGMITDQEILNIVRSSVSPQQACESLVEAANAAGGGDNITVVIIQAAA